MHPLTSVDILVLQDPISNFGVVLGAVSKRAMGGLGLSSGNNLADKVIPCYLIDLYNVPVVGIYLIYLVL